MSGDKTPKPTGGAEPSKSEPFGEGEKKAESIDETEPLLFEEDTPFQTPAGPDTTHPTIRPDPIYDEGRMQVDTDPNIVIAALHQVAVRNGEIKAEPAKVVGFKAEPTPTSEKAKADLKQSFAEARGDARVKQVHAAADEIIKDHLQNRSSENPSKKSVFRSGEGTFIGPAPEDPKEVEFNGNIVVDKSLSPYTPQDDSSHASAKFMGLFVLIVCLAWIISPPLDSSSALPPRVKAPDVELTTTIGPAQPEVASVPVPKPPDPPAPAPTPKPAEAVLPPTPPPAIPPKPPEPPPPPPPVLRVTKEDIQKEREAKAIEIEREKEWEEIRRNGGIAKWLASDEEEETLHPPKPKPKPPVTQKPVEPEESPSLNVMHDIIKRHRLR